MRAVLGDPDVIISRRTIFPFFRPFQSQEHIQAALNIMKGLQLGSIKYKLGLVTGRFGAEHPLKHVTPVLMLTLITTELLTGIFAINIQA